MVDEKRGQRGGTALQLEAEFAQGVVEDAEYRFAGFVGVHRAGVQVIGHRHFEEQAILAGDAGLVDDREGKGSDLIEKIGEASEGDGGRLPALL